MTAGKVIANFSSREGGRDNVLVQENVSEPFSPDKQQQQSVPTSSHEAASAAPLLANASATDERTTRGNTLMISTRRRSSCLQASAKIGDQSPTSPERASRSMSHMSGIRLRSPLFRCFSSARVGGDGGGGGTQRGVRNIAVGDGVSFRCDRDPRIKNSHPPQRNSSKQPGFARSKTSAKTTRC